ncbi:transcription factor MYB86-like [Senna tora]|uniref:Transcription factor MYB86-like n=1 Tax=Senna tora TaxID=362788 RepID=A0A835CDG8_9FABA|nr:transcription factor MYB86-like [Senna tora]
MRKGLWSPEEDEKLFNYITSYGVGCWSSVPKLAEMWKELPIEMDQLSEARFEERHVLPRGGGSHHHSSPSSRQQVYIYIYIPTSHYY